MLKTVKGCVKRVKNTLEHVFYAVIAVNTVILYTTNFYSPINTVTLINLTFNIFLYIKLWIFQKNFISLRLPLWPYVCFGVLQYTFQKGVSLFEAAETNVLESNYNRLVVSSEPQLNI